MIPVKSVLTAAQPVVHPIAQATAQGIVFGASVAGTIFGVGLGWMAVKSVVNVASSALDFMTSKLTPTKEEYMTDEEHEAWIRKLVRQEMADVQPATTTQPA